MGHESQCWLPQPQGEGREGGSWHWDVGGAGLTVHRESAKNQASPLGAGAGDDILAESWVLTTTDTHRMSQELPQKHADLGSEALCSSPLFPEAESELGIPLCVCVIC